MAEANKNEEPKLFALVDLETGKVSDFFGPAPFDGHNVEDVEKEIGAMLSEKGWLEALGLEVRPLTKQYLDEYMAMDDGESSEEPLLKLVDDKEPTKTYRLSFSQTLGYNLMIRAIQVLPVFDALQLQAISLDALGTVTSKLAGLTSAGYIRKTGAKIDYDLTELRKNRHLDSMVFNYNKANQTAAARTTASFEKTEKFPEFLDRLEAYRKKREAK